MSDIVQLGVCSVPKWKLSITPVCADTVQKLHCLKELESRVGEQSGEQRGEQRGNRGYYVKQREH